MLVYQRVADFSTNFSREKDGENDGRMGIMLGMDRLVNHGFCYLIC